MHTTPCLNCGRESRPGRSNATDYPEGTPQIQARGMCVKCYAKWRRGTTTNSKPTRNPLNTREQRIEDIEFLLRHDGNAEQIATRAGFTNATTAIRLLDRWGRHDLAQLLRRNTVHVDVYTNDQWQYAAFTAA